MDPAASPSASSLWAIGVGGGALSRGAPSLTHTRKVQLAAQLFTWNPLFVAKASSQTLILRCFNRMSLRMAAVQPRSSEFSLIRWFRPHLTERV